MTFWRGAVEEMTWRGEVEHLTIYPTGQEALDRAEIDWADDNIKTLLVTREYWPTPQHRYYSDVEHEARGVHYPRGGYAVTGRTICADDGVRVLDANDIKSPPMTVIARSAILYKDTGDPQTSPLICCLRFDKDQDLRVGTLTVEVASTGLLRLPAAEPTDTEGGALA